MLWHTTQSHELCLIIYDVACQWSINFHRRVQDSHFLSLPHITDLIPAVGKFIWQLMCLDFCKVQLELCPSAGQLDGEILETLWSEFNKVSTVHVP